MISTHLPPPVMIESEAVAGVRHPHVVLQLRHVLCRCRILRERPGQHELGLEDRPGLLDHAVQRRRHPFVDGMANALLHVLDVLPGAALEPATVQLLGHRAELNDQVLREIRRRQLAALFPPQPDEVFLIVAHDDAGIRSADEVASVVGVETNDLMRRRNCVVLNSLCTDASCSAGDRSPHCRKPAHGRGEIWGARSSRPVGRISTAPIARNASPFCSNIVALLRAAIPSAGVITQGKYKREHDAAALSKRTQFHRPLRAARVLRCVASDLEVAIQLKAPPAGCACR